MKRLTITIGGTTVLIHAEPEDGKQMEIHLAEGRLQLRFDDNPDMPVLVKPGLALTIQVEGRD